MPIEPSPERTHTRQRFTGADITGIPSTRLTTPDVLTEDTVTEARPRRVRVRLAAAEAGAEAWRRESEPKHHQKN